MEGSKSYFFVIKKMKYNKKLFKILLNGLLYQDSNHNLIECLNDVNIRVFCVGNEVRID